MLECAKSRPFALRGPASFLLITWPLFSVPYWTFVSTWKIEEKSHAGWKYRRLFLEGMDITPSTFLWPQLKSIATLNATPWTAVQGILQARILEWVAFPFSRGSSKPRDQIQVSCIAGGFFTSSATREALRKTRAPDLATGG